MEKFSIPSSLQNIATVCLNLLTKSNSQCSYSLKCSSVTFEQNNDDDKMMMAKLLVTNIVMIMIMMLAVILMTEIVVFFTLLIYEKNYHKKLNLSITKQLTNGLSG